LFRRRLSGRRLLFCRRGIEERRRTFRGWFLRRERDVRQLLGWLRGRWSIGNILFALLGPECCRW
jgi:hypothetical protein